MCVYIYIYTYTYIQRHTAKPQHAILLQTFGETKHRAFKVRSVLSCLAQLT